MEIAQDQSHCLLNKKEEYNRCLLPSLVSVGPPSIKEQKSLDQPRNLPLSQAQIEAALSQARFAAKKRTREGRRELQHQSKRLKISRNQWTSSDNFSLDLYNLKESRIQDYFKVLEREPPRTTINPGDTVSKVKDPKKLRRQGEKLKDSKITSFFTRKNKDPGELKPRMGPSSNPAGAVTNQGSQDTLEVPLLCDHIQVPIQTLDEEKEPPDSQPIQQEPHEDPLPIAQTERNMPQRMLRTSTGTVIAQKRLKIL